MKKINTKVSKRIAAIILAALAACSVMGCSVEKNFTVTETHTETDANGNTTIEFIKKAMKSFSLSFDDACDKLMINDKEKYRGHING